MTKQRPRIGLTVDDELNDLLTKLSDLSDQPKTKIILDIVKDAQPYLEEIIKALEMAKNAKDSRQPVTLLADLANLANEQMNIINDEMAKVQEK